MAAWSTIALGAIALGSLRYSIYAGEKQRGLQNRALIQQEAAQREAENAAIRQAREAEEAENSAKRKSPDINALLAREQKPKPSGPAIDPNRLLLGRPGLLSGSRPLGG